MHFYIIKHQFKMSPIKTLKSTPTCFDQQLIIIRELIFSYLKSLKIKIRVFITGDVVMRRDSLHLFYVVSGVEWYAVCRLFSSPHQTPHTYKQNTLCCRITTSPSMKTRILISDFN
jgi:hypothetical protein